MLGSEQSLKLGTYGFNDKLQPKPTTEDKENN
jgi:hypothetical protein